MSSKHFAIYAALLLSSITQLECRQTPSSRKRSLPDGFFDGVPLDLEPPFVPSERLPHLHRGFTPIHGPHDFRPSFQYPERFHSHLYTQALLPTRSRHTFSTIDHSVPFPVPHHIPFHVNRHFPVPFHVPVPVDVPRPVQISVPHPVPVDVPRPVPYSVPRPFGVPVQQAFPVPLTQGIGFPIPQQYPFNIPFDLAQPIANFGLGFPNGLGL